MPMTNTELLEAAHRSPPQLFSGLDRQRIMLLGLALTKMPCPNCGTLQDQLEASETTLDEYSFDAGSEKHHCIGCERQLTIAVPFVAMGPRWHWSVAPDPSQVRK
jgi:hypothetical protein